VLKILTLNNISVAGLDRLPRDRYEVASEIAHPDAVLVRSADMHGMEIPSTLKAVGRAGAGVNNIPVDKMSARGIAVFNAPGANANAVKELVVAGMLIACRNIAPAWEFARSLEGDEDSMNKQMEAGKKRFAGFELPGRTLGVIGLGAIGIKVANVAIVLGMKVIGYDPDITVQRAWQLSSDVQQANSIDHLLSVADFITFHVPLTATTRHLIDADRLRIMKSGAVILNFSRHGIVDDLAVLEAVAAGKIYAYVCDFPTPMLKDHPRVIALPHIGASTKEAEDNCAIMAVEEVSDYLENGNIRNAVNLPEVVMPRTEGTRIAVVNANVPNMVGQMSTAMGHAGLNIVDMLNRSRGNLAYTLTDVDKEVPPSVVGAIAAIDGVLAVRTL
jgi:D-3-phosphoglycerate dehydrogenase / 2-oxoglutarate reductase